MSLSNLLKILVFSLAVIAFLTGCGSSPANQAKAPGAQASPGRFPFPTKEPEVYQGDFVVGDGVTEDQYFVARKGDKWRFDMHRDGAPWTSQMRSDRVYSIDHTDKTYAIEASDDAKDFDTGHFNTLSWGFFRGVDYLDFEEIGREGSRVKYRARMRRDAKSEVVVTIDEPTGMMVRQEITSDKDRLEDGSSMKYVYEVRNLRLEVDDSVFEIPAGYKQVARRKTNQ